jgi:hypothetical protein
LRGRTASAGGERAREVHDEKIAGCLVGPTHLEALPQRGITENATPLQLPSARSDRPVESTEGEQSLPGRSVESPRDRLGAVRSQALRVSHLCPHAVNCKRPRSSEISDARGDGRATTAVSSPLRGRKHSMSLIETLRSALFLSHTATDLLWYQGRSTMLRHLKEGRVYGHACGIRLPTTEWNSLPMMQVDEHVFVTCPQCGSSISWRSLRVVPPPAARQRGAG